VCIKTLFLDTIDERQTEKERKKERILVRIKEKLRNFQKEKKRKDN